MQAAVTDADAAVAAGQTFAIMRVDVGLDPKALLEAWNAIQKQHPTLPVIMFSLDQGMLASARCWLRCMHLLVNSSSKALFEQIHVHVIVLVETVRHHADRGVNY